MSRFFNETRKPGTAQSNGTPAFAAVDIQDAVEALKKGVKDDPPPAHSHVSVLEPFFGVLNKTSEITSQVTAVRLENCRKTNLPRDNEKSFLAAQYNPGMQLAVEAYRTLRTRLVKRQTEQGTRSLVISSANQGEGKTLTAFNLALSYANIQNWPVLLIDTDLRTRGLSRLLGDPESPGLAKVLESGVPYQSAILATSTPNLYFLPVPAPRHRRSCFRKTAGKSSSAGAPNPSAWSSLTLLQCWVWLTLNSSPRRARA